MDHVIQDPLFDYDVPEAIKSPKPIPSLPDDWTSDQAVDAIEDALLSGFKARCAGRVESQELIARFGLMITHMLLRKNANYGDSALNPVSVFSTGMSPRQRMAVRMDDKVSRIARGAGGRGDDGESPVVDLIGYLILDLVAEWREEKDKDVA